MTQPTQPLVGIVMGSDSDWPTMQAAAVILKDFGVPFETRVVSAHRTPDLLFAYADSRRSARPPGDHRRRRRRCPPARHARRQDHRAGPRRAGADRRRLSGVDSLHSIVQMPKGIPVATFAIGEAGAANAALFAVAMLANHDAALNERLRAFRQAQTDKVLAMKLPEV